MGFLENSQYILDLLDLNYFIGNLEKLMNKTRKSLLIDEILLLIDLESHELFKLKISSLEILLKKLQNFTP